MAHPWLVSIPQHIPEWHQRRSERLLVSPRKKLSTPHLLGPQVVSHKVLLQFLVGVVDAQLFQAVVGKGLKSVHIQQA